MTPLDEILEAAGIPQDATPRVLARRDGHRVVTSPSWVSQPVHAGSSFLTKARLEAAIEEARRRHTNPLPYHYAVNRQGDVLQGPFTRAQLDQWTTTDQEAE